MRFAWSIACRGLCSKTSKNNGKELKRYLHRFYQLVHPDRFAQEPQRRDTNLKSFQILQAALDRHFNTEDTGTRDYTPDPITSQTTLTFFGHSTNPDGAPRKARAELQPGPRSLAEALLKLFAQLELDPPPAHILTPPSAPSPAERKYTSISDLAKVARSLAITRATARQEAATQAAASSAEQAGDAKVLLLALQRAHGVKLTIDSSLPRDSRLAFVLTRVWDALRDATMDLNASPAVPPFRGMNIIVDAGFHVNSNVPELCVLLGACASREQWDSVLQDEELLAACREKRVRAERIRNLELKAAERLGCSLVFHHFSEKPVDEVPRYFALIESLAEGPQSESYFPIGAMLVDGSDVEEDVENGVIAIGVDQAIEEVRRIFQERGPSIGEKHTRILEEREARERDKQIVIRSLRLGTLNRRTTVADCQWVHCLKELRKHGSKLKGLGFEGADISVTNGDAGVSETGEIFLPWDFSTRMRP